MKFDLGKLLARRDRAGLEAAAEAAARHLAALDMLEGRPAKSAPPRDEWPRVRRRARRDRSRVLQRDGFACRYCGARANPMTIDHVLPISKGGTNDLRNLVSCCMSCNSRKGPRTPEQAGMVLR